MFNLFAYLADFECDIIREQTKAGLTAARACWPLQTDSCQSLGD